ncbi:MAG: hypothetical protein DMG55_24455 [Acidobacteria bacterium]|nr:MAG: hypothetical protein DMG55_24455 [Acidobacteriota bacterium]
MSAIFQYLLKSSTRIPSALDEVRDLFDLTIMRDLEESEDRRPRHDSNWVTLLAHPRGSQRGSAATK